MFDLMFLKKKGAYVQNEILFNSLYQEWEVKHGAKKANFDQENEDFFKDTVKRVYEHDSIHKVIAFYDEPMFNKIKVDKNKAAVEKDLVFDRLGHTDKLKVCWEEIYAVALERFLIPQNFHLHPKTARHRIT